MTKLQKLKEIAESAPAVKLEQCNFIRVQRPFYFEDEFIDVRDAEGFSVSPDLAKHIATFNPFTVLKLLEVIELLYEGKVQIS